MNQEIFNSYISEFKKLPIEEKRKIFKDETKELLAVISTLNKQTPMLLNKELLDIENTNKYTEDDFIEAMYVYICSIKEEIGNYLLNNI